MKLLASVLTVVGLAVLGHASPAMASGSCSRAVYLAAYQAALQADKTFLWAGQVHMASVIQWRAGETEVSFYDYPYEITVDVFFNHNCKITGVEERDNSREISGGGA
jgi:hypothetical protein